MTDHEHDRREEEVLSYGVARASALEPVDPGAHLRARLMATMARSGRYGRFVDRLARLFDLSIVRVEELLARVEDPSTFRLSMSEGVALVPVVPGPSLAGASAALGRLAPGARFPHHRHVGDEITLVLDGGLRDDDGREVWRGEELYKPAGTTHDFVGVGSETCVAAVIARGGVVYR